MEVSFGTGFSRNFKDEYTLAYLSLPDKLTPPIIKNLFEIKGDGKNGAIEFLHKGTSYYLDLSLGDKFTRIAETKANDPASAFLSLLEKLNPNLIEWRYKVLQGVKEFNDKKLNVIH